MQLIKKIEIHYLRSIYSASLTNVGDLNLFFGRNDSGKSNVLRALNLFFNDETDPSSNFDFDIDMSDLRKKKAAEAKGRQFVWIKITFNVPVNFQKSLGKEISIKKQWNRYGGEVNYTSSPSFSGGKASILTRFINQIDFTYIPAIKDLEVYANLIERMYSSAAENQAMLQATTNFIDAIGVETAGLTEQLKEIFSGNAKLAAPSDMAVLFRNLDFSHGEEGHSLFKQKGDGIKARHLPELLRFINRSEPNKRFFIWGFEEPENSLDLSAAASEAERFVSFSAREDTQVFISSHSPAFYLAPSGEQSAVRRYFVDRQKLDESGDVTPDQATSSIDTPSDADRVMRAAGLMQLPFVINALSEQRVELETSRKEVAALKGQLDKLQVPTIFVEGIHDIRAYKRILKDFGIEGNIEIKKLAGTPKSTKEFIASLSEAGGLVPDKKTLFIFDNDNAGRSALHTLTGKNADLTGKPIRVGDGNLSAAVLPASTKQFSEFVQYVGLSQNEIKFTLELLLANQECLHFLSKATDKNRKWLDCIHEDYYKRPQELTNRLRGYNTGSFGWLYARMVPDELKKDYLSVALRNIDKECNALATLLETIRVALDLKINV